MIWKNEKNRRKLSALTGLITVWAMIYLPFFITQEFFIQVFRNNTAGEIYILNNLFNNPPNINCSYNPTDEYILKYGKYSA
jgi:hypothetical protein